MVNIRNVIEKNKLEAGVLNNLKFTECKKRVFVSDAGKKRVHVTVENADIDTIKAIYEKFDDLDVYYSKSATTTIGAWYHKTDDKVEVNNIIFEVEGNTEGSKTITNIIMYKKIGEIEAKITFKTNSCHIFQYDIEYAGKTSRSKIVGSRLFNNNKLASSFFKEHNQIKWYSSNHINRYTYYNTEQNIDLAFNIIGDLLK